MSTVFGQAYAGAYDALYRDKDYDGECDMLERVFRAYAARPIRRVLDMGCGTGNHALRLAARKYAVAGVDRSAEMLRLAEQKAREQKLPVKFQCSEIVKADLGETFDAALMMFAVLGYHLENDDVLGALRAARRHLAADGLLVFDVWHGPAVLSERPGDRVRVLENAGETLLRTTSTALDSQRHVCTVEFHLWRMKEGRVLQETREQHPMRYFFPQELKLMLDVAGFKLRRLGVFPQFERDPDESVWNVLAVAQAG